MKRFLAVLTLLSLLVPGCVTTQSAYLRDGKEYGVTRGLFRHRWWNYYERGMSFGEGAFQQEAINDFREAIKQRSDDQWRARTYGMHFVDYFPHRELGIAYYHLGRLEEGLRELEASLAGAESAKAKFFLNKIRAEQLKQSGRDVHAPVITIVEPREGTVTKAFAVRVAGHAEDDTFVGSVSVNGKSVPFELSAQRLSFDTEIPLENGENKITVLARDLLGKTAETTLTVTADRRGPVITVADLRVSRNGTRVEGFVEDDTGVATCTINGNSVTLESPLDSPFAATVAGDPVRIVATDRAGNVTVAEMPASQGAWRRPSLPLLASAAETVFDVPGGVLIPKRGLPPPERYALSLDGILDTVPPTITLKELAESQEVFEDRVLIEGTVIDQSTIKGVTINGEQILRKEGKQVFFSRLAPLNVGGNVIEVEAKDTLGNKGRQSVSVVRREQKVRQIGSRMRLAVLPLEHTGSASAIGSAVYDSFVSAIVNQGRFDLVERAKVDDVLRELKLSASDLVDPANAAKAGRLAAAEALVTGTVVETASAIEVIARVVDTETSLILASNDVFDEDKTLRAMMGLMDRLAYKFTRDFPLLEGLVIEAKDGEIMVDLGTQHRMKKNLRLIVFREGDPVRHPVTGKILGADTQELALAQVTKVFEEFSKATIARKEGSIRPMDRVITK